MGTRNAILNDLAPGATFIAAGLNLPPMRDAFDRASAELLDRFDREYGWMYQTTVDGQPARIDYTIWSEVFTCPHCGGGSLLLRRRIRPSDGQVARRVRLHPIAVRQSPKAGSRDGLTRVRTLAGDTIDRIGYQPVRIAWSRAWGRQRTVRRSLSTTGHGSDRSSRWP